MAREVWARIVALCQELETLLDTSDDEGLNWYLTDSDTYISDVWNGLPHLREYAEERQRNERSGGDGR